LNKAQLKNLSNKYKIDWRNYYTGQNLVSVRIAALIFLLLNAVIRVLYLALPLSLTRADNFPEFNITNWVFLGSSLLFYLLSYLMMDIYRKNPKGTAIMSLFIFAFAMYLIGCGMYSSFMATSDPKNAMILYLIALSTVSILFVFEYYETIMLIIAVELIFTSLLIWTQTDPTEMVYDQLISLILLGGFINPTITFR